MNYTIIIPHKNTPDLLQKCLGSIPERDDAEVIVIDDDSDKDIVDISRLNLYAKTIGSCIITISTADGRFNSYLNVLVSTG